MLNIVNDMEDSNSNNRLISEPNEQSMITEGSYNKAKSRIDKIGNTIFNALDEINRNIGISIKTN